ncbi:MAG: putative transport protein YdiK [Syntrophus sp. SKADARSKE-3]|nr:putative transport protein YdiK [Syntrophus sp. SKADARSKE-3]
MKLNRSTTPDLPRITLQFLWIGILIAASFWILKPFLPSLIWAAMIVAATWPFMLKVQGWLGGKRGLAVAAMTLSMLLLLIVPLSIAIIAIVENADKISIWVKTLGTQTLPTLPTWVEGIPFAGPKLAAAWNGLAVGPEGLSARLTPYAGKLLNWFLSEAGSVGKIAVQFLLTVVISAIFYSRGEAAAMGVIRFARRLGGQHGEDAAVLAAKTVRGVALGVVGTALIQSVLGGIGLAVAGVPAATVLTAVMFVLCISQIGPGLVLIPAIIWLYYGDQMAWGTVLLIWSIFVTAIEHFLRPILIKKGADLPLFLIFSGVIGGLVAFGIVGLFIGPVVLAISYRLLAVWVGGADKNPAENPVESLSSLD